MLNVADFSLISVVFIIEKIITDSSIAMHNMTVD